MAAVAARTGLRRVATDRQSDYRARLVNRRRPTADLGQQRNRGFDQFAIAARAIRIRLEAHLQMAAAFDDVARKRAVADEIAALHGYEPRQRPRRNHFEIGVERGRRWRQSESGARSAEVELDQRAVR